MSDSMTSVAGSQLHVALVAGGMSTERDISLASASNVGKALVSAGYRVTFVDMDTDIAVQLSTLRPDVVFNCLHGAFGEDGCLPGLLNIMRLPYTHSGVFASSLAFDKIRAKQWFRLIGVATAESVVVRKGEVAARTGDPMDRPYVIKPRAQGGSFGVEIVLAGADFDFASYAYPYGDQVLVERFVSGREFTVAVLNGRALGAKEVHHSKSQQYRQTGDERSKSSAPTPPLADAVNAQLLATAEKVFASLGCRGVARLDYMVEERTERIFLLELNTHPGMREISEFPKIAASCAGLDMRYLIDEMIKGATCDSQ